MAKIIQQDASVTASEVPLSEALEDPCSETISIGNGGKVTSLFILLLSACLYCATGRGGGPIIPFMASEVAITWDKVASDV